MMSQWFPISNGISHGIIEYFINKSLNSIIKVTSSGYYYSNRPAQNLLYREEGFYTERNSRFGQWILFNFTENLIDFVGYSILSGWKTEEPSNWRIEVSTDGSNWSIADTKSQQVTYNPGKIYSTSTFHKVKLIKFVQTGPNGAGLNFVLISAIDFFGNLYLNNAPTTKRMKIQNNFHYIIIVLLHS